MHTQNETPENQPSIARLIRSADILLRAERHDALAAAAVNPRAVRALRRIAAHPDAPAPTGHRAGRLHRLVEAGLVSVDAEGVRLTEAGTAMLAQADAVLGDLDARAFASVDTDDADRLRAALTSVIDALGGQERLRSLRDQRRTGRGHGFGRGHRRSEHRGHRGFGPAHRDCGHGAGHGAGDERGEHRGRGPFGPRGGRDFGPRAERCDHRERGMRDGGHRAGFGPDAGHRGHHRQHDERAYERGFAAGAAFASGHDADH